MGGSNNQESSVLSAPGRVVLDSMRYVQLKASLRVYSLSLISEHFFAQPMETVEEETIAEWFWSDGDGSRRRRAALFVCARAQLARRVLTARLAVEELVEMARVTGLPMRQVWTRGQMLRSWSLLLRCCRQHGFVVPAARSRKGMNEGPLILDPCPPSEEHPHGLGSAGLHNAPVAVLDFASLYPSIIIAHNLCFSTMLPSGGGGGGGSVADDVLVTPVGAAFVHASRRAGLLPRILRVLLARRAQAKAALARESDSHVAAVLQGRQLALKLAANALYGFTGASASNLPCIPLAESVVTLGVDILRKTMTWLEDTYPDVVIVYGDTDSVMLRFPDGTRVEDAIRRAQEASRGASELFADPIRLKFEKVFCPFYLQQIRRYAGLVWTRVGGDKHEGMEVKGLECVMRNTMPALARLMRRILWLLMMGRKHEAIAETQQALADVVQDKYDHYDLLWTRGLWRRGEYDSRQPHVDLVERLERAKPHRKYKLGERVPFVLVQRERGAPLYRKAEHPVTALVEGMPLDLAEYLKQFRMPLARLFAVFLPEKEVEAILHGSRTARVGRARGKAGALHRFFATSSRRCLGCDKRLLAAAGGDDGEDDCRSLCDTCDAHHAAVLSRAASRVRKVHLAYAEVESHCRLVCQRGGAWQDITCRNEDCRLFYRRLRWQRDLQRMSISWEKLRAALEW
eukprot:PLAT15516.2.p1 GENE.PLAT15516.2~~PLAT15516.2.p1  ORF type:complete len:686 (-),score=224.56 PLAT15516.2:1116-3173(-)